MFGIIGSGKLGVSMGRYMKEKGIPISGIYSLDTKESEADSKMLGIKSFSSTDKLLTSSKIVMIAVPDDSISQVWKEIKGKKIRGKEVEG